MRNSITGNILIIFVPIILFVAPLSVYASTNYGDDTYSAGNYSSTSSATQPGDANADGHVNGVDYVIWLNHYGQNVTGVDKGDFNNNGVVDGVDYVIWLNNYGV